MDTHSPRLDCLTFRQFAKRYMPETFHADWRSEQNDMLSIIESLASGQVRRAAMVKRGIGTTSLFEAATVWAIVKRMHRGVLLLLETQAAAAAIASNVCDEFAYNPRIAERFGPFKATRLRGNIAICGKGIDAVVVARGIHCGIRGISAKDSRHTTLRPSLILIDVAMPSDESTSVSLVTRAREVIERDVPAAGAVHRPTSFVLATQNGGLIPQWGS